MSDVLVRLANDSKTPTPSAQDESPRALTPVAVGDSTSPLSLPNDADAIECVRALVSTPSVSGEEAAAVRVFLRFASEWGFETQIDEVGNGVATRRTPAQDGQSQAPPTELVLLGHIDTVAGNIPVRIEHGVLHGRGSVDAKGPLAAMLAAAARADLPSNCVVRVVAALGEETPHSPGARHLARTWKPHACIIGEPSGWTGVTLGYKGRLVMHARLEQANGHSAGPRGSAADSLMHYWRTALDAVERLNEPHKGAFDTIQATLRAMQSQSDGLHDMAEVCTGFRLPLWVTPEVLEALLVALGQPVKGLTLRFEGHEVAHASDRNDPVVRALSAGVRTVGERPHPKLKTGTADLNVVAPPWQCPIAAYGPGDSSLDHTPTEHLSLDEYCRSIRVLTHAIHSVLCELRSVPPLNPPA